MEKGEQTIDGRELGMYISQCTYCKHLEKEGLTCVAFPDGIPDDLLAGDAKHDIPIKGQIGDTVFANAF